MKVIVLSIALVVVLVPGLASAQDYARGSVTIDHPWSRPTPPGTPMGVGYLALANHGDNAITLTGAETPRAARVTLHESSMKDGVMLMQPVKGGLVIPAGEVVELKPHGYHLMLEKLNAPLVEGERIPVTLTFDGAEDMAIELTVEPLDGRVEKQETDMDHSGHSMSD